MKNNETFKRFLRAMYQIIVVELLLLPFRLLYFIYSILIGLMAVDIKGYYNKFIKTIRWAYKTRIHFVKNGSLEDTYFDGIELY